MSELILVLKSLIFATIVAILLQFQVKGKTVENHLTNLAGSQMIQNHLQLAARGAVSLAENIKIKSQKLAKDALDSFRPNTPSDKK
jgi:hypothetical protein